MSSNSHYFAPNSLWTHLSVDALRVLDDLLQALDHLGAVDVAHDAVVLTLLASDAQKVFPAGVR